MSSSAASRLIFLSDLPTRTRGDKVRFLGWVERYDPTTGTATLKHNYPASSDSVIAKVQLDHVLETITSTSTQVGAWLNVVGTVGKIGKLSRRRGNNLHASAVAIDAVMVWEAKGIKLDEYEKVVEARKACNSTG